jgi:hypothetical protein
MEPLNQPSGSFKSPLQLSRCPVAKQLGYLRYRQCLFKCKDRVDRHGNPIRMLLTFDEWWTIWEDSGRWPERGTKLGQYFMMRKDYLGSYELGNVSIAAHTACTLKIKQTKGFLLQVTCPHCAKTGNAAAMARWHFDACIKL